MARVVLEPLLARDWAQLMAGLEGASLVQSWEYAEAKVRGGPWTVERGRLVVGARTEGAFQALIRRLPAGLGGLAWINRGPLWARGADRPALMAALRQHYAETCGFYLRVAPAWPAENDEVEACQLAGMRPAGVAGWASAMVDLAREETDLRRGLAQKWRNVLNRAERDGVSVEAGADGSRFAAFLADYRALLADRGFATTVTPELLTSYRDLTSADCRPEVLTACKDGETLGRVLIARFGGVAEYLAGTVGETGRRAGAGQCLLWTALTRAKAQGFQGFDLGGLDPDLTPRGIRRFKEGLGGVPYRLAGEAEALPGGLPGALSGRLVRARVRAARGAS